MADADPRLVAAATALAMTDLRRSGKTAPRVLERVLPYYMRAAEVCVSAYLATPAQLGTEAADEPVREALQDAISVAARSRRGTIGATEVFTPQIDVRRVDRWRKALAERDRG